MTPRLLAALLAATTLFALAGPASAGESQQVTLRTKVHSAGSGPNGTAKLTGPITGAPFGHGTIVYFVKIANNVATATFTATFPDGSISGKGRANVTTANGKTTYKGTVDITKGTKSFKTVRATGLKLTGQNNPDNTVSLTAKGTIAFNPTG